MKCPTCGAENPEAARFCQVCGRSVTSGHQYQQSELQTTTTTVTQLHDRDERMRGADLPLAATLIIVGVAVVVLSVAAIGYSNNLDHLERDVFVSAGGNGFLMAFVGAGMMIHLLSRRRASPGPKRIAGEPTPEKTFFREMEPPSLLGAVNGFQTQTAEREIQVSGGVRAILYLLSICVPALGSVAGAALCVNAKPNYGRIGRKCMIISVLSLLVLTAIVAFVYVTIHFTF